MAEGTFAKLISPHPRAECVKRLHGVVGSAWSILPGSGVVGSVEGDHVRMRKKIYYRNTFQPTLDVSIADAPGGGTALHCRVTFFPLVPIFIAAGVIFIIAVAITAYTAMNRNVILQDVPLAAVIAPLASIPFFIALGFGTVYFGRWVARNEPAFLVDFLKKTVDAKDA